MQRENETGSRREGEDVKFSLVSPMISVFMTENDQACEIGLVVSHFLS